MMESPEGNRIAATSSSAPSPAVQESPFFNYLRNLSPIKSVKAARYTQRFSESNFPTPSPVFTSPHLVLQRETSFLKSEQIDAAGSDVYRQCDTQSDAVLIPCFQKEIQSCSPSGCIDGYLADPVGADYTNSADLHELRASVVPQLVQSGFTGPRETITKAGTTNDRNMEARALTSSNPVEGDLPLSSLNLAEMAVDQRDDGRFDEFLEFMSERVNNHVESNMFLDPVYEAQHHELHVSQVSQNVRLQTADGHHDKQDGRCQAYPESLQCIEAYGDCADSSKPVSIRSVKEANQLQRGTRRHLQFEAAMTRKITSSSNSHMSNVTHDMANSRLSASPSNLESLAPCHVELRGDSSSRQAVSCAQNITSRSSFCTSEFVRSTKNCRNLAISAPIPSGIGLHLNSIARSGSTGSEMIASKTLSGYLSSQDEKLMPEMSHNLAMDSNNTSTSGVAGELCAHVDDDQQKSQAVVAANSATSRSTNHMELPYDSRHVTLFEQQAAPCEGRMPTSQPADRVEESNQVSPKRKRKRGTYTSESNGCKRCNCKRSRCLKLYCECFAAGVYCVDSCACENCFNKPEFEDTVLDTRQQIESRNPLAFAPKIVKRGTDSPANVVEEGNWATPSSARHKRGCNCKRSKCLKKYCECYQAEVGCSDGCRCEGCNNSFGKKAESIYQRAERWNNPSHENLDVVETMNDCIQDGTTNQFSQTWEELADISNLTPLSRSHSEAVASSASRNIRDCSKVSQALSHRGTSHQSSASYHRWHCSTASVTPEVCGGSKAPHDLCSDSALYEMVDDDTPEILKENSTPTKAVKASSPNQKRVSPPLLLSQGLRSRSSPGLRSGRKFILQAVPSFPPLTPYSNSKDGINQMGHNHQGSTTDN